MRSECMQERMVYNRNMPISRIASLIGESNQILIVEAQINTQRYGQRPYGVGLIIIGCDVQFSLNSRNLVPVFLNVHRLETTLIAWLFL